MAGTTNVRFRGAQADLHSTIYWVAGIPRQGLKTYEIFRSFEELKTFETERCYP